MPGPGIHRPRRLILDTSGQDVFGCIQVYVLIAWWMGRRKINLLKNLHAKFTNHLTSAMTDGSTTIHHV